MLFDTNHRAAAVQVPSCQGDLSRDKEYFKRYRVCRTHSNAREVRSGRRLREPAVVQRCWVGFLVQCVGQTLV